MKLVKKASVLLVKKLTKWGVRNLVAVGLLLVAADASGQCEVAELEASDPSAWALFGESIAISLNGEYIIAGAYQDDENGTSAGAAYVFKREADGWSFQVKLLASDGQPGDYFGSTIVLTPSGDYAAVSAGASGNPGKVYVLQSVGATWQEIALLTASDGDPSDGFGSGIGVSRMADTILVGARHDDDQGLNSGSAYVFVRVGKLWSEQVELTASDAQEQDWFGYAVALSADGNIALIGAPLEDEAASNAGSVYVFERTGQTWAEIDKLHASIPDQNANFGAAISLSDDGHTALIGARNEGAAGGAYIFVRQGEVWIEQAHLLPPPGGGGFFGSAVSISADGNTAMVSAAEEFARGAAYIFTRKGEQWSEPTRLAACDTGIDDQFATAVALSGDATIAIAGAIWHEEIFEYQGAAYVFDLTMAPCYGDLSCDGQVGVLDLLLLLNRWGPCDNCYIGCADFTGDCVVGVPDLLILLGNWG